MWALTALAAVAVMLPSANAFFAIAPAHVQAASLSRTRTMSVSETRMPALRMPGGSALAKRRITTMSAATLDDSTEWTLSMSFAKDGSTAQDLVTAKVKFMEDEGYEPPQGRVLLDGDSKYLAASSQCFWKLGEDPAKEGFDKAGFWIWGLFEEPAYPFFFFELDIIEVSHRFSVSRRSVSTLSAHISQICRNPCMHALASTQRYASGPRLWGSLCRLLVHVPAAQCAHMRLNSKV